MAFRLIFSQIAFAITMQKKEGIFILKIFDIFLQPSIELIYLLSCFYTKVSIIKPNTSRYANSEKYIVCENFKFQTTKKISKKFHSVLTVLSKMDLNIYKISSIINIPIQYIYLLKIKEINVVLGQQQIETITNTKYKLKNVINEFSNNSIYKNQIISQNKKISSIIIYLKKNDDYIINGSKNWITNATISDIFLIWALDENNNVQGIIIEKKDKGVQTSSIENKLSLLLSPTGQITLSDVKVKKERIIEQIRDRRRYKKPSVAKKEKRARAERARQRERLKKQRAQERRKRI